MTSSCFVCDGRPQDPRRESPHNWLQPRHACADHKAQAVLANGTRLATLWETPTAGEQPPEGSALNVIINPVTIQAHRGWADYAAGGWTILEEIFPSSSYFEFFVQHTDWGLELLYALHAQRDLFSGGANVRAFATCFKTPQEWEQFGRLQALWGTERYILLELARRQRQAVASPAEAAEIRHKVDAAGDTFAPGDMEKFSDALLKLAGQRFAHL